MSRSPVVRVAIIADNKQLKKELNDSKSKLSSFGKSVAKVGVAAGAAAGAGIVALGVASVKAASDAQQSLGATDTVFGKFAKNVVDTSNQAAESVGLSANAYREQANVLGALLGNQGVAQDQLAGKTKSLIGTAADLAATFGGTTQDAVEALSAAFKGEFDPLEKYGISLKQSSVSAEAWRAAGVTTLKAFKALTPEQQKSAQRMATNNLLMGQAAKVQGAFASENDTLAHKQQVLNAQLDDAKTKIGTALIPVVTDLVGWLSKNLVPALEDFGQWLNDNKGNISDIADNISSHLLPVLKDLFDRLTVLGGILLDVAGWIDDLPGPVKKFGAEAAVAAALVGKFGPILSGLKGTFDTFITNMKDSTTRTEALRKAAKFAAGTAGLALLADSAGRAGTNIGTIESVAGGAFLGFSVGGPIGAAIGAGAGALQSFSSAAHASWEATKAGIQFNEDYAGSFDSITGAATEATRTIAFGNLQKGDQLTVSRMLGIPDRTMVDAAMGDAKAMARVRKVVIAASKGPDAFFNKESASDFLNSIGVERQQMAGAARDARKQAHATQDLGDALKKLPKRIRPQIKVQGLPNTVKDIAKLARQFKLTPKQIKTLIKLSGVPTTVKDVERVKNGLEGVKKTRGHLPKFTADVRKDATTAARVAANQAAKIARSLFSGTGTAKANLTPFGNSVQNQLGTIKGEAYTGGHGVGSAMKEGASAGLAGVGALLAGTFSSAVTIAIAAARAAAKAKSPSRETYDLGQDLALGLIHGLRGSEQALAQAGASASKATLSGMAPGRAHGGSERIRTVSSKNGSTTTTVTATTPVQLAPRQAPVAVYLDGIQIADQIALRNQRMAVTDTIRRSA